jgi:hypothetical protein
MESMFTASLHLSDFVQPQNKAKLLTNSPFGYSETKITWLVWKYIPGPNQKLLPLFVTMGQRLKQSNEKNHTTITPPQSLKSTRVNRVIISTNKKLSKIQNNRKIEKSLQVAQKRGTEILQVPNSVDPLKSSNWEKSVKAGFVLLRLLAQEAENHELKILQSLDCAKPETGYPQIDIF